MRIEKETITDASASNVLFEIRNKHGHIPLLMVFTVIVFECYYLCRLSPEFGMARSCGMASFFIVMLYLFGFFSCRAARNRTRARMRKVLPQVTRRVVLDDDGLLLETEGVTSIQVSWATISTFRVNDKRITFQTDFVDIILRRAHFTDVEVNHFLAFMGAKKQSGTFMMRTVSGFGKQAKTDGTPTHRQIPPSHPSNSPC